MKNEKLAAPTASFHGMLGCPIHRAGLQYVAYHVSVDLRVTSNGLSSATGGPCDTSVARRRLTYESVTAVRRSLRPV